MSRSFFVTTPIYYMNADPHIGHTYTTVVADTLARYHKLRGDRTFFLTGSDEHGEKVLETARNTDRTPREVADHFSAVFRSTWDSLGIRYDRFIRTTDADHRKVVQAVLQTVHDRGQIYFKEYEGSYCVGCERFLTERDMEGDLCRDHERRPEKRSESNYFFRMSEHFEWLRNHLRDRPDFIRPERYRNEVLSMLREESGLGDLCISRPKTRLDWGIELPFDDKFVCYVWFDALINYLTGIGYPDSADFEDLWAGCEHLVAKDILKPHAIFWPTMLHAIGIEPAAHLNVHGYWNVDDRKVSKSLGNMVSPLIMRERYGFDAFRYFLLRDMVFGTDSNFSEPALVARINSDLANNLGNLVSRTLHMTARYTDGRVPEPAHAEEPEQAVRAAVEQAGDSLATHMERMEPHRALEAIFRAVDETNRYLELREPWKAARQPEGEASVRTALFTCAQALRSIAILLSPFIPQKAQEILERLGQPEALESARLPGALAWGGIPIGSTTTKGAPLFPRIESGERR